MAKTNPAKLDFLNLPELPREMGATVQDLGFKNRNEYLTTCRQMAHNKNAKKRMAVVLEVFKEFMARDLEDRDVRDDFGNVPVRIVRNDSGQAVKVPVEETELRGKWDVDDGPDTAIAGEGPGRVRPKAGHWKNFVEEHWEHLAPQLLFREAGAKPHRQDPEANPETYRAQVEYSLSDEHPDRQELKEWLPKFIEMGAGSSWDGRRSYFAEQMKKDLEHAEAA